MSLVKCNLQQCLLDISLWRATCVLGTQHGFFWDDSLVTPLAGNSIKCIQIPVQDISHLNKKNGQLGLCLNIT